MLLIASAIASGGAAMQPPVPQDAASFDTARLADPFVKQAIEGARNEVESHPGDARRLMHLGQVYHGNGFLREAYAVYLQLLETDSTREVARYLMAEIEFRLGNLDAALDGLEALIEGDPRPLYLRKYGVLLLEIGRINDAHRAFQRALEAQPGHLAAQVGMARVHLLRNEPSSAEVVIRRHLLGTTYDAYGRQLLAESLRRQRRLLESRIEAARVGTAQPALYDPILKPVHAQNTGFGRIRDQAQRLLRNGNLDEARALLEDVLTVAPHDALTLNSIALVHRQRGDIAASRRLLEKAERHAPRSALIQQNLAIIHFVLSETGESTVEKALSYLHESIALDPTDPDGYAILGNHHLVQDDPERALEAFHHASRNAGNDPTFDQRIGTILHDLGRTDEAIEAWRRALERDPSFTPAALKLADALITAGRNREARGVLEHLSYLVGSHDPRLVALRARVADY